MTIIKEILSAIIEAKNEGARYFGVRSDNIELEIGTYLEASYDWDYENDCQSEEKLNGTSATKINIIWFDGEEEDIEAIAEALEYHKKTYSYNYTTIIAGENQEYGADENEAIISNAQVIYKIQD